MLERKSHKILVKNPRSKLRGIFEVAKENLVRGKPRGIRTAQRLVAVLSAGIMPLLSASQHVVLMINRPLIFQRVVLPSIGDSPRKTSLELIKVYIKDDGFCKTTKEDVFKKFLIPDSFYEKFLKGKPRALLGTKKIPDANDKNVWHRRDYIIVKFEDPKKEPCFLIKEE